MAPARDLNWKAPTRQEVEANEAIAAGYKLAAKILATSDPERAARCRIMSRRFAGAALRGQGRETGPLHALQHPGGPRAGLQRVK